MKTPASIKDHPIHPMLVALPIGLWVFSLISDIIYLAGWGPAVWATVALYTLGGGIVTALIAAVPGFVDLLSIHDPKYKRIAVAHMVLNLVAVAFVAINWWLRFRGAIDPGTAFVLSFAGVVLILISGWLGGTLVHRYRVSVEERNVRPAT